MRNRFFLKDKLINATFIVGLLIYSMQDLRAQRALLDVELGINVIKPYCNNYSGKSAWTHNFWGGINYRIRQSPGMAFNIGLLSNGINYRFSSPDSPQVTFITLNYISVPLQIEFLSGKSPFSVLMGMEPKRLWRGYENTSQPIISRKLIFNKDNQIYNRYNMAFRAGISYRLKQMHYFLQGSGDLIPFRSYQKSTFTDVKIIFGLTLVPVYRKK